MNKHENSENISLLEAIETLSVIADIEVDPNIVVEDTGDIVIGERKVIEWLNLQDQDETLRLVRDIFGVIHKYLRNIYKIRNESQRSEKIIEGIKTIMVLVGEATKNLDKYTQLFHGVHAKSITQLQEYKQLQSFYQNKISREVDTKQLSRWIFALAEQPKPEQKTKLRGRARLQTRHEFVDLDSVKKDSEYELFYIRKEDGSRFFSPQLVKNITLVCDFGDSLIDSKQKDPLLNIANWKDSVAQTSAASLRSYIESMIPRFTRETFSKNDHEVVIDLRSALFALILAASPTNIRGHDEERKSCIDYFHDFYYFLRCALATREYERMVAYPPERSDRFSNAVMDLIQRICSGLFLELKGEQVLQPEVHGMIEEALHSVSPEHLAQKEESRQVWNALACDYAAMSKLIRRHRHGPLLKVLRSIQENTHPYFDPLWQDNIPSELYTLHLHDGKITNTRMPCPVHQEAVNRVVIAEEFKGFIAALKNSPVLHHHLVINLQDRTSWREHARSKAMEDLQNIGDNSEVLTVVTLAKDTDFYRQNDPYANENHSVIFIESLLDHLQDYASGYYFPDSIMGELFPEFAHNLTDAIHRIFFNEKNVLTRDQRLDFIEITYMFLILKLIEIVNPQSFCIMCKDGVDVSSPTSALLFTFFKLLHQEELKESDFDVINSIIYTPALLQRERIIIPERFNRLTSALKAIESIRQEWGQKLFKQIILDSIGCHYNTPILESHCFNPKR